MELGSLVLAFLVGFGVGVVVSSPGGGSSPSSVAGYLDARREQLEEDYREGRVSLDRLESEHDLLLDPRTERVMYAVVDVDGVGPSTAFELAREYRSVEALDSASPGDLEAVNGVGENRANAIYSRDLG